MTASNHEILTQIESLQAAVTRIKTAVLEILELAIDPGLNMEGEALPKQAPETPGRVALITLEIPEDMYHAVSECAGKRYSLESDFREKWILDAIRATLGREKSIFHHGV